MLSCRPCAATDSLMGMRPATPEEIADTLAFALRYEGKKRVFHADDAMARITADHLVRALEASGYVVSKRDAAAAPTTSNLPAPDRT